MFTAPLQIGRAGGQAEPAKSGSLGGQGAGRVFAHGPWQPESANPRPLGGKGRAAQLARLLLLLLAGACAGCSSLLSNVVEGLAADLSAAILENPDVDLVRDGAPAYLILIDGLLKSAPENVTLLSQAAVLNSAYAGAFVAERERSRGMAQKARALAFRAVCLGVRDGCGLRTRPFPEFERWTAGLGLADVPLMYSLATSWAGWIQVNSEDFNAIAELARVKALMRRVAELDEGYEYGGPHVYLGVFELLLPPALGGRPELGRQHFERALALSEGRHLLTKVLFAEHYARLMFDRPLHDLLLNEVLQAEIQVPDLQLMNAIAKRQARQLLDSADAYF